MYIIKFKSQQKNLVDMMLTGCNNFRWKKCTIISVKKVKPPNANQVSHSCEKAMLGTEKERQ